MALSRGTLLADNYKLYVSFRQQARIGKRPVTHNDIVSADFFFFSCAVVFSGDAIIYQYYDIVKQNYNIGQIVTNYSCIIMRYW